MSELSALELEMAYLLDWRLVPAYAELEAFHAALRDPRGEYWMPWLNCVKPPTAVAAPAHAHEGAATREAAAIAPNGSDTSSDDGSDATATIASSSMDGAVVTGAAPPPKMPRNDSFGGLVGWLLRGGRANTAEDSLASQLQKRTPGKLPTGKAAQANSPVSVLNVNRALRRHMRPASVAKDLSSWGGAK